MIFGLGVMLMCSLLWMMYVGDFWRMFEGCGICCCWKFVFVWVTSLWVVPLLIFLWVVSRVVLAYLYFFNW